MEIWVNIKDWEGKYLISNYGRIKSIGGKFRRSLPEGYISFGSVDYEGYMCTTLRKPGLKHRERVHTIVARHFLEKPDSKERLVVNHKDGNKQNNHVSNLEYISNADNIRHAVKIGLMDNKGENHGMSKLTKEQVIEMRMLRKQGLLHKEIADRFGICRRQAGDIINGVNWGWLKDGL